jgi:hypothetical protein
MQSPGAGFGDELELPPQRMRALPLSPLYSHSIVAGGFEEMS